MQIFATDRLMTQPKMSAFWLVIASCGASVGCSRSNESSAPSANGAVASPSPARPARDSDAVARLSDAALSSAPSVAGATSPASAEDAEGSGQASEIAPGRSSWQAVAERQDRHATSAHITTFLWNRRVTMAVMAAPELSGWYTFAAHTDPCYVRDVGRTTMTRCDVEVTRVSAPANSDVGRPLAPPTLGVACVNAHGAVVLFDRSEAAPRVATLAPAIEPGHVALVQVASVQNCWLHGGTSLVFVASAPARGRQGPRPSAGQAPVDDEGY